MLECLFDFNDKEEYAQKNLHNYDSYIQKNYDKNPSMLPFLEQANTNEDNPINFLDDSTVGNRCGAYSALFGLYYVFFQNNFKLNAESICQYCLDKLKNDHASLQYVIWYYAQIHVSYQKNTRVLENFFEFYHCVEGPSLRNNIAPKLEEAARSLNKKTPILCTIIYKHIMGAHCTCLIYDPIRRILIHYDPDFGIMIAYFYKGGNLVSCIEELLIFMQKKRGLILEPFPCVKASVYGQIKIMGAEYFNIVSAPIEFKVKALDEHIINITNNGLSGQSLKDILSLNTQDLKTTSFKYFQNIEANEVKTASKEKQFKNSLTKKPLYAQSVVVGRRICPICKKGTVDYVSNYLYALCSNCGERFWTYQD